MTHARSRRTIVGLLALAAAATTSLALAPVPAQEDWKETTPAKTAEAPKRVGEAWPLTTCPVSGRPIATEGDVPTLILADMRDASQNGREVRFCCNGCKGRVAANPEEWVAKLDAAIVKDQLKVYPAGPCPVMSDEALPDPRGAQATEAEHTVIGNRLVRTCCKRCARRVAGDTKKWMVELDKAIIAAQASAYPLKVCVISGAELGDDPVEFTVANRLVRTCCGGCKKKVLANPTAAIAAIDAANATR